MVGHRQAERATHTATVFSGEDGEWDDDGEYIGTEPIGEVDVRFVSGGEGWVQSDTGQRVHRDPTLDWPPTEADLADEGRELHLRPIGDPAPGDPDPEFVIESVRETFGRHRTLDKISVDVSSV